MDTLWYSRTTGVGITNYAEIRAEINRIAEKAEKEWQMATYGSKPSKIVKKPPKKKKGK